MRAPIAARRSTVITAVLSLALMLIALVQLFRPLAPLVITNEHLNDIPLTVYTPRSADAPAPVVVIAHGFAGSRQLMGQFAVTLARAGYTAITFDFPGHGQSTTPLQGGLLDREERNEQLEATLDTVVAEARQLGNGQVALLGHSMGSQAVTSYAQAHPQIAATVAVSLGSASVTATSPRNLLLLTGALESSLQPTAQNIIDVAAGGAGELATTYGSFTDGSARRAVFPGAVEHIGVLFSPTSLDESLRWFDAAFNRATPDQPYLDGRVIWVALLFLGAVGLFWSLVTIAGRNMQLADVPTRSANMRRQSALLWWVVALAAAILAPLLLRLLPVQDVLPILVGGPLSFFFLVYGVVTLLGLVLLRRTWGDQKGLASNHYGVVVLLALFTFGYVLLTFGLPAQQFLLNYFPPTPRWWVFVAVFVAMLPYFLGDEWLTRSVHAPRGAYAITKVFFVFALAAAIALDQRLFFLVLVAPVFILYFVIYWLFSGWLFRATATPLPGALANAAIFAWFVAAVFPLVG